MFLTPASWLIVGLATALIALIIAKGWLLIRPSAYHRRMQSQANQALEKFRAGLSANPGAIISYLRKMNPHAVEELVLTAAQQAGHKIQRNRRYTADGGIDGQICINNVWHLVQTKRYSSAINPQHVAEFAELCTRRGQPGLFIHCGRTGDKARENATYNVSFVSGQSLIALIQGHPLSGAVAAHPAA